VCVRERECVCVGERERAHLPSSHPRAVGCGGGRQDGGMRARMPDVEGLAFGLSVWCLVFSVEC